jgi:hypothetical protein
MKNLKLPVLLVMSCLNFISCMRNDISISGGSLFHTTLPSKPLQVSISLIPTGHSSTPAFTISHDGSASAYELQVYKADSDALVVDWTPLSSTGSVNGLFLEEGTMYYALIRSVNRVGVSPEIRTETWLPNSEGCFGERLSKLPFAGGDGSVNSPFLICQVASLLEANRESYTQSHFKLLADLNVIGANFSGIGTEFKPFRGQFNGNGRSIKNAEGFFKKTKKAFVEHLTLINLSKPFVESCEHSFIKHVSIVDALIEGDSSVGAVAGQSEGCSFHNITSSGKVQARGVGIGGLIGSASNTSLLNVISTVSVEGSEKIGGLIGEGSKEITIQNSNVMNVTLRGLSDIGGLVGVAKDATYIYRSSFKGSGSGRGVGGLIGNADSESCEIASVESQFAFNGQGLIGGIAGVHKNCKYRDVKASGFIEASSSSAESFGGAFGAVTGEGSLVSSSIEVSITGQGKKVGGLIGSKSNVTADLFVIQENSIVSNVEGSDSLSLFIGDDSGTPLTGSSVYWTGGTCLNHSGGGCSSVAGTGNPSLSSFFQKSSSLYSDWDYSEVWQENTLALPSLRFSQSRPPGFTSGACPKDALLGVPYRCDVDVLDEDRNETQFISPESQHTCRWISPRLKSLLGVAEESFDKSCEVAFVVTDGFNKSAQESFSVTLHDDMTILPSYVEKAFSFGTQNVSTGSKVQVFTVRNAKATPITSLTFAGLSSGEFSRTGGTCGTTLAGNSSCTISISFDPSSQEMLEDKMILNYQTGSKTVQINFHLEGTGI